MMRNRTAAILAVALFLVLTGTGVSHAYWSTHATGRVSVQAASVDNACRSSATGNLDTTSVGTAPCLTAATTLTNVTSPGTPPRVGDTLEYTTTVRNQGGLPSAQTRFAGTLPDGLSFVGGSLRTTGTTRSDAAGDDQAEYVAPTRAFTAHLGSGASAAAGGAIAPAGSATFTLRAMVAVPAATNAAMTISYAVATVSYVDQRAPRWPMTVSPDPVVSDISTAAADLATSHAVMIATLPEATTGRWTITASNKGPHPTTESMVQVVVPAGLTNPSVTVGTSVCPTVSETPRTVDCDTGTMLVGQSKTIIVTGTVPPTNTGTSLTMTATVRGPLYDPQPSNNMTGSSVIVTSSVSPPNVGP